MNEQRPLAPKPPHTSPAYANYVLAVMVLMYTMNYLDRFVLTILVSDIKRDLQLSDSMMGFLMGPAFALFYVVGGFPIARWADRGSRRLVIGLGLSFWSLFTALSGLARSASELALARVCIGVGEAAGAAPAHSLISDYFPPERRATALSFFQGGVYLGSMLGLVIGGVLAEPLGWRATFIAVGLPGLAVALLIRWTVREPPRGAFDPPHAASEKASIREVVVTLGRKPTFWYVALGAGIASFGGTGLGFWMPTFFERVHDMSKLEIGLRFGIIQYVSAFLGAILTGRIADWLGGRDLRWYAWVGGISVAMMLPFFTLLLLWPDGREAIYFVIPCGLLSADWAPVAYSVAQNLAPPHMRAMASAFIILFITFLGTGLGPWAVGFLNDWFAPRYGDEAVRWSLLIMLWICLLGAMLFALAARTIRRDMPAREPLAPGTPDIG